MRARWLADILLGALVALLILWLQPAPAASQAAAPVSPRAYLAVSASEFCAVTAPTVAPTATPTPVPGSLQVLRVLNDGQVLDVTNRISTWRFNVVSFFGNSRAADWAIGDVLQYTAPTPTRHATLTNYRTSEVVDVIQQ
jgi:hypothetical protein